MTSKQLISRIFGISGAQEHRGGRFYFSKFLPLATELGRVDRGFSQVAPLDRIVEFFTELKINRADIDGFDLDRVVDARVGNCVELSVLLILLIRELGIGVAGVRVPNHMFTRVRHHNRWVNVEPACAAPPLSDAEYRRKYQVTKRQEENGLCMVPLSDQTLLAQIAHKISFSSLARGEAISCELRRVLRLALHAHPKGIETYNSLGLNYMLRHYCPVKSRIISTGYVPRL